MEENTFDKYAHNYNEVLQNSLAGYGKNISYYARHKSIVISQNLTAQPKTILDFGCGIGRNIEFLKQYFPSAEVTGYDVSPESVEVAKKYNPLTQFYDKTNVRELESKVDIILIACVFHHIPPANRAKVMGLAKDLLSDTGEIFVFEHNPFNPLTRHIVKNCPLDKDAVLLKPSEVKALAYANSLLVTKQGYTLYLPAALKFLQPAEQLLTRLPLGTQYFVRASSS
jgi:2-polyprenyl-3-methyl-5-hydroxy-6-metoxy-1,4-benzoquinol methylase